MSTWRNGCFKLQCTSSCLDSSSWENWPIMLRGGFRNSERGQIFGLPRPLSVTLEVRAEYLKATLSLVKCLEIIKELIRECVTMPGCCCCMPLLHNHLMDSCSYVRKNTLLAAKGGCICTPLTPLESAHNAHSTTSHFHSGANLWFENESTSLRHWKTTSRKVDDL